MPSPERAHHGADVATRPAHLVEPAIVRIEAQLGFGHFQALEGLYLRARHLFLDELLGIAGRRQQGREVGGLQLEVDVAAVAEAAEQVALRRERLGIRETRPRISSLMSRPSSSMSSGSSGRTPMLVPNAPAST